MSNEPEFREVVIARARNDEAFRRSLLGEAIELLLSGELEAAKILLGDIVCSSDDVETLAAEAGISVRSLRRMFRRESKRRAEPLLMVVAYLRRSLFAK